MREPQRAPTHIQSPRQPKQTPLAALPKGVDGIIVDILETPDLQRCAEVGFLPGAHVRMLNPGDPSAISLNGARLAISRRLLASMIVSYFE